MRTHIPSTDNATVDINPNNVSHTDCGDVTGATMTCSFNTTSSTTYTMDLSATSFIGTNSTNVTFDCKLLKANYPDSKIVPFHCIQLT